MEVDDKIEAFRHTHESSAEWNLRKPFLEAHYDKFDEIRLKCLSSCFINVHVYGCSYPAGVMEQMRLLSEDVQDAIDDFQATDQKKNEVKFVKASDQGNEPSLNLKPTKSIQSVESRFVKATDTFNDQNNQPKITLKPISNIQSVESRFVKETGNSKIKIIHKQPDPLLKVKQMLDLTAASENPISSLHEACAKAKIPLQDDYQTVPSCLFRCTLLLNNSECFTGEAPKKKAAKFKAYTSAIEKLKELSDNLHIMELPPRNLKRRFSNVPGNFCLYELGFIENKPVEVIQRSCEANKVQYSYNFREAGELGDRQICELIINGQVLADICIDSDGPKIAKINVADRALAMLRRTNWTIIKKVKVSSADAKISKSEVDDEITQVLSEKIPESNIGNKLLQMMGWKGGGLGSDGSGIAEPVSVSGVIHRQGLGLNSTPGQGLTRQFQDRLKKMLYEFQGSDDKEDMSFSPEFLKEERAFIHKEAQKLNLKSVSYGKDDERYIVIRKKTTISSVQRKLWDDGGENHEYKLIAPGKHPDLPENL